MKFSIFKYLKLIEKYKNRERETLKKKNTKLSVISGLDCKGTRYAHTRTPKFGFQFLRFSRLFVEV